MCVSFHLHSVEKTQFYFIFYFFPFFIRQEFNFGKWNSSPLLCSMESQVANIKKKTLSFGQVTWKLTPASLWQKKEGKTDRQTMDSNWKRNCSSPPADMKYRIALRWRRLLKIHFTCKFTENGILLHPNNYFYPLR